MTLEEKYALYFEEGKQIGIEIGKKDNKGKGLEEAVMTFVDSRRKDGYTEEEIQKEVQHIFSVDMKKLNA